MREPQDIEDEEHEQVIERVAAVDVAKASGMVAHGCRIPAGWAAGAPPPTPLQVFAGLTRGASFGPFSHDPTTEAPASANATAAPTRTRNCSPQDDCRM